MPLPVIIVPIAPGLNATRIVYIEIFLSSKNIYFQVFEIFLLKTIFLFLHLE